MQERVTVNLDDRAACAAIDPLDMAGYIAGLPAQCRAAWAAGLAWEPPATFRAPKRVVILGMGGSAIGGEVVTTLAARMASIPMQIVRGYHAPDVDDDTLVIASSWSGETEETLEAFQRTLGGEDHLQEPMRLAITTGGRLGRLGDALGYSVLSYEFAGQPRSAIGWGVFALLGVLHRMQAMHVPERMVEESIAQLEQCATDWGIDQPGESNVAKQIARRIQGRVPVIFGPDFLEVAARRWAGQMSENAKQWGLFAALPELDHNLIVGFGGPDGAREALHVLMLDNAGVHDRTRLRIQLTGEALDRAGIQHDELLIGGDNHLDAIMRACYLSDWVSLYLAYLVGADPTEVRAISTLKDALGQHARG
ncbi:MAG: bifunctional phosphoglucose/phosphomannose isomerase [Dehalococcoidia bacterium]